MDHISRGQGLNKYFPILDWLPHYKPEWLRFDLIAALSVWALLVPQGIAYSSRQKARPAAKSMMIGSSSNAVVKLW